MDVQDDSIGKFVQVNSSETPIHRLPEELLVYVFQIIVRYSPLSIGRLLFVSRYWYSVIRNMPSLWSRIRIAPRISNDILKCTQYAMVTLANSTDSLLDITIDLHQYTYWDKRRYGLSPNRSLLELDDVHFTRLFRVLLGNDGSNLARWRSFRVRLPYPSSQFEPNTAFGRFIEELRHPIPHLESLSLHLNPADEYFPKIRGTLQHLRRLTMDAGGHLGYLDYHPKNIEILYFRLWNSTKVISQFTNLQHLSISSAPNYGITHKDDPVIVFPLLQSLTLHVWYSWLGLSSVKELTRKIRAPLLDTLRLLGDDAILAVAEATAFHHVDTLDLLSLKEVPDILLRFIRDSLPSYTALTSLTVTPWHIGYVRNGLRTLKDKGRLPVHLETVYTIVSDNEGIALNYGTANSVLTMGRLASEYLYRSHSLSG